MLYESYGKVVVYPTYIVAYVNPEISRYYRNLMPKYMYVEQQKYPAHVTIIIKDEEELPSNSSIVDGKRIKLYYDSEVKYSDMYVWLNVYSEDIEKIRVSLGLSKCRYSCFHITIGNMKGINNER